MTQQISKLREELADILQNEEEWTEAAKVLQGIPLDSGQRAISDDYKLEIYIKIVRLLLEDDDPVGAETTFKRAALLIHGTKNKELQRASVQPRTL